MREAKTNASEVYDDVDESWTTDEEESGRGESDEGEDDESAEEGEDHDEKEAGDDGIEPSGDIRGDIEEALDQLDFDGSYYFHKELTSAPNPVLRVSGLGRLALPLSNRDALRLKILCAEAEGVEFERCIGGPWELSGSEVRFENPAWRKWIGSVMRDVRNGLGVDTTQSRPYCDLDKLLLYSGGLHLCLSQDTEKPDGTFATLIIILPSQFTGGAMYLSRGEESVLIDSSINSLSSTSVLAWYSNVAYAVQPVRSGYRLALVYNIVHASPSNSSRQTSIPRLPSSDAATRKLRGAFLAWRDQMFERGMPMKIICLLEHQYGQAELKREGRGVLKGVDAYMISHLERVAREYGFRLGLANLECHVDGVPRAPGRYDRYYHYRDSDENGKERRRHEWVMEEILDQDMTITGLVDLVGRAILPQVEHEDDTQMIPEELEETVIEGKHYDEHFDHSGKYTPSLERWYRRNVVVIWPGARHNELLHGKGYATQALKALSSGASSLSSAVERRRVETTAKPAGHPRKRRKLTEDEVEIIDLTSP